MNTIVWCYVQYSKLYLERIDLCNQLKLSRTKAWWL